MDHQRSLLLTALTALIPLATARGAAAPGAAAGPVPLRQVLSFDSGWRFYRGEASQAWRPRFNDSGWRRVELPHDFSIEDLPPVTGSKQPPLMVVPGPWKFKQGDDPSWKQPGFDDSGWTTVQLPAGWRSHLTGELTNSYGWYRRRIDAPGLRGKPVLLVLGKVDDVDETFVNGVKVGGMGTFPPHYATAWQSSRRYLIPAGLLKGDGTDVVAVRVYNGDGDGGIYASVSPTHRSGPFDADSEGGTAQGYTEGSIGWYRRTFLLPEALQRRRAELTFDGVYMDSTVWLNGHQIGEHPYGYTGFTFDITPWLRTGRESNLLAVRVNTSGRTSRWYSGSGIYRHAWLTLTNPVHIAHEGVFVTTPEVSVERAAVRMAVTVANETGREQPVSVEWRTPGELSGEPLAQASGLLPARGQRTLDLEHLFLHPRLWSPEDPALLTASIVVLAGGRAVDAVTRPYGIRSITVDSTHGLLLNGLPIKLQGGCVHHDNGALGSAAYDAAEDRRVRLLKEAGFNAIRTSHNPPSPAFLDACDRYGMLVMDEAFDCWRYGKNPQDYGRFFDAWWKTDLDSMVLRDRSHPSVIIWSIGNEIPEQASPEGAETAAKLAAEVRSLDPTRPVAEATNPNGDKLDSLLAHLDVAGYNYASGRYESDHEKHPDRVFAGTESFPEAAFDSWMATVDQPYVIGDFVWTAMDYLGEAGIGKTVPQSTPPGYGDNRLWTVSNCGDLDITGQRRPQSYYRGVLWHHDTVALFAQALGPDGKPERVEGWGWPDERPSWTWPGREGKPITVRAFSWMPRVRLLLNGRDLGTKETTRRTRFIATWDVPYEPGQLVAVALAEDGREAGRVVLQTAGSPAALRVPGPIRPISGVHTLAFIPVEVVDAHGVVDPNGSPEIRFHLDGPGKIIAVSNADPRSEESFRAAHRRAFRGRCLVVVELRGSSGAVRLRAEAPGLRAAAIPVQARARQADLIHDGPGNSGDSLEKSGDAAAGAEGQFR